MARIQWKIKDHLHNISQTLPCTGNVGTSLHANPRHEGEIVCATRCYDVVDGVVEHGYRAFGLMSWRFFGHCHAHDLPVTPTITSGWHAAREKTRDASTDDRSTSLTPKLWSVFANMSRLKARAGRMLRRRQSTITLHPKSTTRASWNDDVLLLHGYLQQCIDAQTYLAKYMYTVAGTTR
jgi:hypothetical protein